MTTLHPDVTLLAHNYVRPEVQAAADYVGDSLELARLARDRVDTPYLVLAGVDFMAETAALLNPEKTVIHPEPFARCAMALRLTPGDLLEARARHPDAAVVSYVNSSAAVKAVSDVCCTSANAVEVVNALDEETVIFVPDRNLALHVAARTDKRIIVVPETGCCPVHHALTVAEIRESRRLYPGAEVMVHPETTPEVQAEADFIGSTSGMLRHAVATTAETVIVGTETGLIPLLEKASPGRRFIPASPHLVCPDMKMITLELIEAAIAGKGPVVTIPGDIAPRARAALERMLLISGG
ncbi:MAG TPA: quinolinate synthase NadA [Methanoregulaceae archaeon]|nr:quinolinate synthase NadA [Methanoregulaceae archaeon]